MFFVVFFLLLAYKPEPKMYTRYFPQVCSPNKRIRYLINEKNVEMGMDDFHLLPPPHYVRNRIRN